MMNNTVAKEAVFLIGGSRFLHLQEVGQDVSYATYDAVTGEQLENGLIPYNNLRPDGKYKMETARNWYLYQIAHCSINGCQRESVNILVKFPASGVQKRWIRGDKTIPDDVRIVNHSYDDLYRIPDGGVVQIDFQDGKCVTEALFYVDDYHLLVGGAGWPLHICEFYQMFSPNDGCCVYPEHLSADDKAVWRLILTDKYIAIQSCNDGWEYKIYDGKYAFTCSGKLDAPELTIEEAREEILDEHNLKQGRRIKLDYEEFSKNIS